jgi:hypothetical protein
MRVLGFMLLSAGALLGANALYAIRLDSIEARLAKLEGKHHSSDSREVEALACVGLGLLLVFLGIHAASSAEEKNGPAVGQPHPGGPALRWSVAGTYASGWSTGPWAIEAASIEEARRQAEALGIRVSAITPLSDQGGTVGPGPSDNKETP